MRTAIPAHSMARVRVLRMVAARAWLRNSTGLDSECAIRGIRPVTTTGEFTGIPGPKDCECNQCHSARHASSPEMPSPWWRLLIDERHLYQLHVDCETKPPVELIEQRGFPARKHFAECGNVLQSQLHDCMFYLSTFADIIFGLIICHAAVVGSVVLQQRKFPVVDPGEIGRVLIIDGPKLLGLSVAQPHILSNDLFLLGSYILAQQVNEVIRIRLRRVARGRGFDRVLPGRRRILCQCRICREHDERQSDYKKFLLVHWDSSHVW